MLGSAILLCLGNANDVAEPVDMQHCRSFAIYMQPMTVAYQMAEVLDGSM